MQANASWREMLRAADEREAGKRRRLDTTNAFHLSGSGKTTCPADNLNERCAKWQFEQVPRALLAPCREKRAALGIDDKNDVCISTFRSLYRRAGDQVADKGEIRVVDDVDSNDDQCRSCRGTNLVTDERLATVSCMDCGHCEDWQPVASEENDPQEWGNRLRTKHVGDYRRVNYFSYRLDCIQGVENSPVIAENSPIIEKMREEMRLRCLSPNDLTHRLVRRILKDIKQSLYYNNVHRIKTILGAPPPPRMTPDQREEMVRRFQEVEEGFLETRDPGRKNMIGIPYVMFKLCEMLGWDEFLPEIALFEDEKKIKQHDKMFRRVCEHIQWHFIPTQHTPLCPMETGVRHSRPASSCTDGEMVTSEQNQL